ncbi:MAG: hypothetical protein A3H93_11445 [Rhodocyclales bacterium RIFCSPLOWO2_02_FULL_63_24]|nr:MAG: hypothetical protein A3H93_11445 [Rhodocyclales bacterium RIFCSPLOWO2_02_FULL_63_24]
MIFLMFLAGFGVWLAAASMLCKRIPRWLGISKHRVVISVLLFPFVLVAPVADELIGRWQFNRLCEREAVVTLSPDWEKVKRAQHTDIPIVPIDGYVIPIKVQRVEYVDLSSGQRFLSFKAFHTNGGLLFGRLGLGLGQTTSCWPEDWIQITNKLNTDQLLKQGTSQ